MALHTWIMLASVLSFILLPTPSSKIGLLEAILLSVPAIFLCFHKKDWGKPKKLPFLLYPIILFISAYLGSCFFWTWSRKTEVISLAAKLHLSVSAIVMLITIVLAIFACWFLASFFCFVKEAFYSSSRKRNMLYISLGSAMTVMLSQIMVGTHVLSMGLFRFLWCCLIVAVVILLFCCLTARIRISVALGTGLCMLLSTANGYIYSFRGRLLDPLDIFSLGTAMNVAENYSLFPIPWGILCGWFFWIGALFCLFRTRSAAEEQSGRTNRLRTGICCAAGILALVCYTMPLKTYHWDKQGAEYSGVLLSFVSNLKEVHVAKPDGYRPEAIEELSATYTMREVQKTDKLPHIIVIMDEAFSDLSVFGQLPTNIEPTPYISSLMETTVSGYALSSVYGGNTANSEFEFLTGNSMAWLSPNAVPYQQYLNSPAFSVISYLKTAYSYHCVAMHPYLANGWNRPSVYKNLGFDECLFLESFPQTDIIREYVSDLEMFKTLIETYESRREEPLFLFGITMQNHGGYAYNYDNFTQSVYLQGFDIPYPRGDQYLSLIHETDKATEHLISYFSSVDEDVVILFFGDHQPRLDKEFYVNFPETLSDSLDNQQSKYMVPFFVWANYPLEAKQVNCTSLNYLSTYLYEAAGIPLPCYNQFLSEMEQIIPAVNANGYYSLEQQRYLPFNEAQGDEQMWLQQYQHLQYNNLFDRKHHNHQLFPLLS